MPSLQIDPSHFAGWLVYGLFVLASFIVLKLYNLRLHKSLGTDPEPELEPEKEEEEEEEDEGEEGRNGEKQSEEEKSTSGTADRSESGRYGFGQTSPGVRENLPRGLGKPPQVFGQTSPGVWANLPRGSGKPPQEFVQEELASSDLGIV